ncbi:hypothetical protein MPTK1_2g14220 [Marchantia polymorpha subsp. ruderalis]|uniref:DUF7812 domain-containing protein n=2 Tax=Marchantia polymorpha TaxID=3197 RepID=A0A2R6X1M7_MARPO|nr:hypothetical protein MARPO_0042s0049 [Marchantia polymorpha]BBN02306.1 hypothetical protein Mp_2g14220 [Marchantia polymorpha subsp. ruderalis]|eukprot:PTQ40007.1 hypothetical protein MARPO_0042s0049 [Marchantia polymorpha]
MSPAFASASEMGRHDIAPVEYDCLHRCLSDLALVDLASKAQLLQSLSAYLSCVASTMSASADDYSLSALVGTLNVRLQNVEVIELHNLLARELKNHTERLAGPHSSSHICSSAEGDRSDEILTRTLHLEVVSETLRCCIRILPLVDCFDTSVSLRGAALLDSLMQQLCSPASLCETLVRLFKHGGLREKQEFSTISNWRTAKTRGGKNGPLANLTQSSDSSSRSDAAGAPDADFQVETQRRMEVFFAILEVYMDELLLCPDLGARLLSFRNETRSFFKEEQLMSSSARHTEASLEAAFVHALLYCLSKLHTHGSGNTAPEDGLLVCNLSLPASLLLLETLAVEKIPAIYMKHIFQLVARVLDSSASREAQMAEMTILTGPEECSFWSGGIDWSYCLKRVSRKRDPVEWILRPRSSSSVTTVHFASSIFEQAMMLFKKISTSSTGGEPGGLVLPQSADNLLVNICAMKYRSLAEILCENSEMEPSEFFARFEGYASQVLDLERATFSRESVDIISSCSDIYLEVVESYVCHDSHVHKARRNTDSLSVEKNGYRYGDSSLVSAALQLGISSLECITREIGNMLRFSSDTPHQVSSEQQRSATLQADDADKILELVSMYLSSFLPSDVQACAEFVDCPSGKRETGTVRRGQSSLIGSVGKAILFFTNIFCGQVQNGAPEELLEDYFRILESLVALLLVVDGKRSSTPSSDLYSTEPNPNVSCDRTTHVHESSIGIREYESSSFSWLEAMVLLLQNMLQEVSAQQRPLPEFFLDFVLEKVSRSDGLNLAAMAFTGSLEPCRGERDLVLQILQLALEKPTRLSSFSTLIGYISDMLEDLLPITAKLSLPEVAESLSCYEHVASSFTLACQTAVSGRVMVLRNDQECRSWLLSRMCEGLERLFTEGTAVAEWISNWNRSVTVSNSQSSCPGEGQNKCGASSTDAEQLECCNHFLVQIEKLRRAVYSMRNASDWFLIAELELSSLSSKSRTFLEAFLRLRMTVDKPMFPKRCFCLSEEKQSLHPATAVVSVELDSLMNNQQEEARSNGMCDISLPGRSCNKKVSESEECDSMADIGTSQEDIARIAVADPLLPGRGSPCEGSPAVEPIPQDSDALMHDSAKDPDPSSVNIDCPLSVREDDSHFEHALICTTQEIQLCGEGTTTTGFPDNREVYKVAMVGEPSTNTVREHDSRGENVHADTQQKGLKCGEEKTSTNCPGKDEPSKVPVVGKRITRSSALLMAESSHHVGEAKLSDAEIVSDPVELPNSKKRQIHSSTTLAIAKRFMQTRQSSGKRAKRENQNSTDRYKEVFDLVPLTSREQETVDLEIEQPRHNIDAKDQEVACTEVVSNPYIHTLLQADSCQESFDDLNDFIVCKKGRNYTQWLKNRQKVRRRLHNRNLFKRLQEKRDLLLLLDIME